MAPEDAASMRSPAWVAVPDADEDEASQVTAQATSISGTFWWLFTSAVMLVALLMSSQAPWWLCAIVGAETYVSLRRLVLSLYGGDAPKPGAAQQARRERRLRHFTSLQLAEGAPVDEIVARYLALDALKEVRSLELGSITNSNMAESRGHSLGLMATFAGLRQRDVFLASPERREFVAFCEPFVSETFVFSFESGAI